MPSFFLGNHKIPVNYYWHNIGTIPHNIGTVLLFRRKSLCVKLSMLKSIPKPEPDPNRTFPKVLFYIPDTSVRFPKSHARIFRVWLFL